MFKDVLNRDLSWLKFNERVMDEAAAGRHTLQDEVVFHGIVRSNLDEFLQTRYPATIGMYDEAGLKEFRKAIVDHYNTLNSSWNHYNDCNSRFVFDETAMNTVERQFLKKYFRENIYPCLQPVTISSNKMIDPRNGLTVFVVTKDDDQTYMNYVEIPKNLPRFIISPNKKYVIPIEVFVMYNLDYLFKGVKIVSSSVFRILRSAEVYVQPDSVKDQYELIEKTLKEREKSWITMLEVAGKKEQIDLLKTIIPITNDTIVLACKPYEFIALGDLKKIPDEIFSEEERTKALVPTNPFPNDTKILDYIRSGDRLVFHPYESYRDTFVRFIEEAADNADVISIKITLYRVANKSRIIDALIKAAENGKQVTVLVELKARFDEGHNMQISRILKEAGVRLVYGAPELKTHAKLCLVTAMQNGKTTIYSHIGTGNYNESNAKIYTDYSYFTADQVIGYDLTRFFNLLTSTQEKFKSKKIFYAPYNLREEIDLQIEKQIKLAKKKKSARITFKCNSLTDDRIAKKLIEAADAGVDVTLIIRGACVVPHHDKIKVYSIVGRFLEHSRVYLFGYGYNESLYIGSNDIMYRNLNRRNELMLKIEDTPIKRRLKKHLKFYIDDNVCRRTRIGDYDYFWEYDMIKNSPYKAKDCQEKFIKEAQRRAI